MSIKTKQVAGVTTLVVLIVALLTAYHLMTLARLNLDETQARGEMISRALFQSAIKVVPPAGTDLTPPCGRTVAFGPSSSPDLGTARHIVLRGDRRSERRSPSPIRRQRTKGSRCPSRRS